MEQVIPMDISEQRQQRNSGLLGNAYSMYFVEGTTFSGQVEYDF